MPEQTDIIEQIAIIGMAGRFPGAKNIYQYWDNLAYGVESISRFTDDELLSRGVPRDKLNDPQYVKAGTILDDAEMFDASFFGYNQREAEIMDPQQRVFLELAWEAMESTGYAPDSYNGAIGAIGVFAGTSGNDYRKRLPDNLKSITSGIDSFELMMGNDADFLTTRISYKLNLKGPSFTIQTACSTSLVAVHQACHNLLTYQCDMALAGGVCIRFPQGLGYLYQEGMIWSPDGHCRPFDAKARGTLFGQGAGIVVLKRLSEAQADNDTILAIIKGSAINNDGAMKVGFTAPSVEGQAEVISTAMALGEVAADTIGYIEAHGTGTPLGDPIEVEALTEAFREGTDKKNYCAIGSVKSNIGHLDAAAGIAGLIKTILALQHKKIPATLHFTKANPNIDFANSPFYVNNTLKDWQNNGQPRRAGVSSFGIGGTNAHVVLEEAPNEQLEGSGSAQPWHLLPLSAKSAPALQKQIANITDHINNHPDQPVADTAWTLQQGRKHFKHRCSLTICSDPQNTTVPSPEPPATAADDREIIFMFSGQGSQYVNMGRDLYHQYPVFKKEMDLCAEILQLHLDFDLRDFLYPSEEKTKEAANQINQTYITQPALFTIEYCLTKLWNHFGIFPSALVGHSIGEYTAACIAGIFSLEEALKLVVARGRLMQSLPPGAMLAIPLSSEDVAPYLNPHIALAVLNSASMSVVSGETEHIETLVGTLAEKGIEGRTLRTSHAFHSPMMEPILEEFKKEVEKTTRNTPRLPFVSNVTGTWITEEQVKNPAYWAKHLRQTVNFYANAEELLTSYPSGIMLEVGPGQTLSMLTRQHPTVTQDHVVLASARRPVERKNDIQYFLTTMGQLWANGCQPEWEKLYEGEKRWRIPLPTYPFERKRYWLQEEVTTLRTAPASCVKPVCSSTKPPKNTVSGMTDMENTIRKIWLAIIPGLEDVSPADNFFDLGGESLQAVQMFAVLEKKTGINLPLATLFEAPTLGELSIKFTQYRKTETKSQMTDPWACLVPIQHEGSRPPFFCVHGAGSNALNYRIFAPALGREQPLYGLQAKGLDGVEEPLSSVEEMASHYIREIKRIQPTGPYFLGGASFGGTVALEIAQQLQQHGDKIVFLVLFDTQGPSKASEQGLQPRTYRQKAGDYIKTLIQTPPQQWLRKITRTCLFFYGKFQCKICRIANKPIPHHLRYAYLERINLSAWFAYKEQYYNGKITLFRAKDIKNREAYKTDHGWADMAAELEIIEIPGQHSTFIEEPQVAEQLRQSLIKAQERTSQ